MDWPQSIWTEKNQTTTKCHQRGLYPVKIEFKNKGENSIFRETNILKVHNQFLSNRNSEGFIPSNLLLNG